MRRLLLIFIFLTVATFLAISQEAEVDSISWVNGYLRFDGVDDLGGQVLVVYNDSYDKIYHERSTEDETIYVRYNDQGVVEYGTIRSTPKRKYTRLEE